jgi:hypothetical protein
MAQTPQYKPQGEMKSGFIVIDFVLPGALTGFIPPSRDCRWFRKENRRSDAFQPPNRRRRVSENGPDSPIPAFVRISGSYAPTRDYNTVEPAVNGNP